MTNLEEKISRIFDEEKHNVPRSLIKVELLSQDKGLNPVLIQRYKEIKVQMTICSCVAPEERLLFHGTTEKNNTSIIRNGFNLNLLGTRTGNKGFYGKGIYLSSLVSTSIYYCYPSIEGGYDNSIKDFKLLCCKVLLGKCQTVNGNNTKTLVGTDIVGYNSRFADTAEQEYIISNPHQILPVAILHIHADNQ